LTFLTILFYEPYQHQEKALWLIGFDHAKIFMKMHLVENVSFPSKIVNEK